MAGKVIADLQESQHVHVHCLGRGTSGILLCGKSEIAKSQLATYFADGTSFISRNIFSYVDGQAHVSKLKTGLDHPHN
jgi:23S rRNA-/tRNA-specific pseudouridylate synthase